jgi:hypothetical protein
MRSAAEVQQLQMECQTQKASEQKLQTEFEGMLRP